MKLIDILVQELPNRGGWPIDSDDERTLTATLPSICWGLDGGSYYAFRGPCDSVSHQLYEETLLARKSGWNGEGLPPVGVQAEVSVDGGRTWCSYKATSERNGMRLVEVGNFTEEFQSNNWTFRPIRSEADKKRDESIESITSLIEYRNGCHAKALAKWLFEEIAAGKIPHIRID